MTGQSSPATVTATSCSQCVFKMAVSIQNPADFLDCVVTGDET
jgi:hypothetical protein